MINFGGGVNGGLDPAVDWSSNMSRKDTKAKSSSKNNESKLKLSTTRSS